jgi:hypothetical protein
MLGRYPENPDILTEYYSRYHFWTPLDIKFLDMQSDIFISGY